MKLLDWLRDRWRDRAGDDESAPPDEDRQADAREREAHWRELREIERVYQATMAERRLIRRQGPEGRDRGRD